MAEPVALGAQRLTISPDDPPRRRSWPNPFNVDHLAHKARYAPASLTEAELLQIAAVVDAYEHIFSISQRAFLPTHSAIRAAGREDREDPS